MSSYFPMSGFRETVCALTGDNQHNCAPTNRVKGLVTDHTMQLCAAFSTYALSSSQHGSVCQNQRIQARHGGVKYVTWFSRHLN